MQPLRVLALLLFLATSAAAQTATVADAGPDQTIDCAPAAGVEVTLDGSGSTGDALTYQWTDGAQTLDGVSPTVMLLPGAYTFTLTVTDAASATSTDAVEITVNADEAPVIVLKGFGTELWAPNHKVHELSAADDLVEEVIDDCSDLTPEDVVFTRATSDEPDDGIGDGSTIDDVRFAGGCGDAFVRAERAGPGNGRVYELFLQVADGAGNLSDEARFRVRVPHDMARDAKKGPIEAEYSCDAGCADGPSECSEAETARVTLRDYANGPSAYFRADGFGAGSIGDTGHQLCLYVEEGLAGGSSGPDKVRIKGDSLRVYTRGADLEIPELPISSNDELRVELHDGAGSCVAATFNDPAVNDGERYRAELE